MADHQRPSSPKKTRGGKLTNVIQGFYHKDEINKHYEIKEVLGRGAFSVVKRAVHKKTGEEYAVKIVLKKKAAEKKDMIETEVAIFKQVDHKNVIKLHELFESKERLFLVTELVTGGELFDQILEKGSYTEKESRKGGPGHASRDQLSPQFGDCPPRSQARKPSFQRQNLQSDTQGDRLWALQNHGQPVDPPPNSMWYPCLCCS